MRKLFILLFTFSLFFALTACGGNEDNETIPIDEEEPIEEIDDSIENTPQLGDEETMVDEVIYPHDEIVSVNIEIDEEDYNDMLDNAMDEEYYLANITYNGYTIGNVGIRTKGNSSLKDVAQAGGDRFSFNIDLNLYEDQDLYGIDKILLNNLYRDPSMMAEYVTYEALESLDLPTPRTTFVELSINGEYFGLYLSVEQIGNEFVETHYGNDDGELYKPELGTGANLEYLGDTANYSAFIDKINDDSTTDAVVDFLEVLSNGGDIESVFNVDDYLKYLAVSTYTVNLDSYQGGISHNYYLYNDNGIFQWLGWDYNMAFNGFPMVNITDAEAIEYLIDEPTVGAMDNYTLINAILSNETYLETYHAYLQELLDGYFEIDSFTSRVQAIDAMIQSSVETDSSAFYTYSQYQDALYTTSTTSYSILQFVEERSANVQDQLDGILASTNNGEGNDGGTTMPGGETRPPRP